MKAVLFDMDGLMFDTERVFVKAWDYVGEQLGLGKTGYMVMKTMGSNTEGCNRIWREEFPGVDIDAMWGHTRDFLEDYYSRNTVTVKKGLYELLEHLKGAGYKLAVASSTKKEKVEHHLQSADVRQYFDAVIGGDMVEKSKPEPDIYQTAAAALGVSPEECYALEDSRNGLLSAYRAGCKVIHVPDLWQPDDTVKSFILGPFEDLLAVRDWLIAQV
ncbi:MAG: HAD-IA family hydrolase [Clostridia bacterium]|nr:HAD-IA family hydrolase [Clostridia bacterium]